MVTAELAMGLPALVFVLLFALALLGAVTAQAQCMDAARIGARAAARGETEDVVRGWAESAAPRGAVVTVHRTEGAVEVRVRAELAGGGRTPIPEVAVEASAVAPVEAAAPVAVAGDGRGGGDGRQVGRVHGGEGGRGHGR
jgi:hypothetical protein